MNWQSLLDETELAKLLPPEYHSFAKPVCEGLAVFLQGLTTLQQAEIFAQQATLSPTTPLPVRLGQLARSCPVLQKMGQILARDQRLAIELREQLRELESLTPTVPFDDIYIALQQELGPLDQLHITLTPPAIAEASVAVVVPFQQKTNGKVRDGVFKILKPGIEQRLEQELALLPQVGHHLDERCKQLNIPPLKYKESFQQVQKKLREEIHLDHEQQRLLEAKEFYADDPQVQIPALFECSTSRVTAMERIWGEKVTDYQFTNPNEAHRLAKLIVKAMIAGPVFSKEANSLFHSDPHAGNLFLTTDGRLAILDWSLVGHLSTEDRTSITQIMLGAVTLAPHRIVSVLEKMAENDDLNRDELHKVVSAWIKKIRQGQFPGLSWLVGMLDESVQYAHLKLSPELVMFRKTLFTLSGVVADVSELAGIFDKVLCLEFLKHFLKEWPRRWITWQNSHEYVTHLSNFDLIQVILSYPHTLTRFWVGKSLDLLADCQIGLNTKSPRIPVE